jgi:hypothetical protein
VDGLMDSRIGTEIDVEFLKRELPRHFLELCKYQQDIIEQYEKYIEQFITHTPVKSTISPFNDSIKLERVEVKRITIPEVRLAMVMSPACRFEWEYLKAMTPRVSPDYFISMAYKEYEEKKNAETD